MTKPPDLNIPRTVLVGGCFDFIHYGHINFLKQAKTYGDILIVALQSDRNVRLFKGDKRPIHNQQQRRQMLESLKFVDTVISLPYMSGDEDYIGLVKKIRPQVIAATPQDPSLDKMRRQAAMVGAKLVIIPKVKTPSTSQLAKLLGLE